MAEKNSITEQLDLIRDYARQETLGPLEGARQWMGMGLLGSLLLMIGGATLTLALLRFLQEEAGSWVTGNLSWLPYLITLGVVSLVIVVLGVRIGKKTL